MRSRSSITLHFRAEAYDHPSGYVDAGTVMSWLDKAGYASAATWAGSNVVANYIGNMRFGHPVPVDTQIAAQARLIYTEGTQVHVQARLALPEVLGDDGEPTVATWVVIVYEAIDAQGEPRVVKEWEPRTEAGHRRRAIAKTRAIEHARGEDALVQVSFPTIGDYRRSVLLSFIAHAAEVTPGFRLQGGALMNWLDEAALCARRVGQENPRLRSLLVACSFIRASMLAILSKSKPASCTPQAFNLFGSARMVGQGGTARPATGGAIHRDYGGCRRWQSRTGTQLATTN